MRRRGVVLVSVLFGTLVLSAAGCGGGGGGGGGPTAPTPPPAPSQGIDFTAAGGTAANSIYLEASDTANTTSAFTVQVRANDVDNVYGVSFDLQYPNGLLRWTEGSFSEGSFLSEGGVQTEVIVERKPAGNLIVGITRVGAADGVSGSGTLLTLEFGNRAVAGRGDLTFTDNAVVDGDGNLQEEVQWVAGSVESRV